MTYFNYLFMNMRPNMGCNPFACCMPSFQMSPMSFNFFNYNSINPFMSVGNGFGFSMSTFQNINYNVPSVPIYNANFGLQNNFNNIFGFGFSGQSQTSNYSIPSFTTNLFYPNLNLSNTSNHSFNISNSGEKLNVSELSASKNCKNLLKRFEGCRLSAYQCSSGTWTIGYGHTTGVKPNSKITQEQAEVYLKEDIKNVESFIKRVVKVPLTQNQFDALVSFTFNVGVGGLQGSTLLKKLNSGDYNGAAKEFLKWNKAGNTKLAGLTARREEERKLFCS